MGTCSCCSYEQNSHKDFIRGGVTIEDFEDEVRPRHPKRRKPRREKYPRQSRPGCVGNDNGAHVYVWTEEVVPTKYLFYRFYGWHSQEWSVCVGCGKRNDSRNSERYEKWKARKWRQRYGGEYNQERGEPVGWPRRGPSYKWWHPESYDPEYQEFKRNYINQNGWTSEVYGPSVW